MATKRINELAEFLVSCLEKKGIHVSEIILFGSQVSGDVHEDSDVDLAVISNDFRNKSFFKRADMIGDAEHIVIKKFMLPLNIILMAPDDFERETSLIVGYVKTGKVIYPCQAARRPKKKAG